MFGFGRKKKAADAEIADTTDAVTTDAVKGDDAAEAAEDTQDDAVTDLFHVDRTAGPFDVEEVDITSGYLDFGSLMIKPDPSVSLRLEVDDKTKSVIAITVQKNNAVLQMQAFAAPKTRGLWEDIRGEIASSVQSQGGRVSYHDGDLGRELSSQIPVTLPDGRKGMRVATFVGIDGPRWFLRGVFTGEASTKAEVRAEMQKIFCSVIVHRGEDPMPPRDLLPLRVPAEIAAAAEQKKDEELSFEVPKRGPEVTQIG